MWESKLSSFMPETLCNKEGRDWVSKNWSQTWNKVAPPLDKVPTK